MATIRTFLRRIGAARLAAAAVLLLGHGAAQATGCRLEFVEPSPLALQPASNVNVSLRAVDSGVGVCTGSNFASSVSSDTTAGTLIAPLTGSLVGNSAPQVLNISTPNLGGGVVTWQAACVSGCEAATPPNPTLTVNVLGGPRELTLLFGTPNEAPPGAQVPVAVVSRPWISLKSRSSPAARRFAGARVSLLEAKLLPGAKPPRWVFLTGPLNFQSSTALRARQAK